MWPESVLCHGTSTFCPGTCLQLKHLACISFISYLPCIDHADSGFGFSYITEKFTISVGLEVGAYIIMMCVQQITLYQGYLHIHKKYVD